MATTIKTLTIPTPNGKEKIDLRDFATKEELAAKVQEVVNNAAAAYTAQATTADNEEVLSHAFEQVRSAMGADEYMAVSFSGTNHLDDVTTVYDALLALDSALSN